MRGSAAVASAAAALALTVLVVGTVLLVVSPERTSDPRVARTDQGGLRAVAEDGMRSWRGVRFAAPPVGARRWQPPAAPGSWDGVRNADSFGPDCVQPDLYTYGQRRLTAKQDSSEDCLFLNVVRPDDDSTDLPVLVWFHGGGFIFGNAATTAGNAGSLASRGLIVVTVNYRLGLLGFFAHPALDTDVANFGILDQIAALEWVHENIGSFGGDPDAVTIAGASAGAMSVNALMSTELSRGLFDKAISQSAPGDWRAQTLEQARKRGGRAFPDLDAAQLRAMPAEEFLSSTFNALTGDAPIVDAVLPVRAVDAFANGTEAPVPYLVGTTAGEFSDEEFGLAGGDADAVRARLGGDDHDRLVRAYRRFGPTAFEDHVLDDLMFTAPAVALAALHDDRAPTYRYRFAVKGAETSHGSEVVYVFDTVNDPQRKRLSRQVSAYWAAFVKTGSPEVDGLPGWPQANGTEVMLFGPRGVRGVQADDWAARVDRLARIIPLDAPLIDQ
ncbi:carboxylesterase/lipase family protein [Nocardioides sp. R-C-SC26]|uniref:carboxylesterase/lipase family protein n=1 Tax=Nocardioides sp. R-C-SC26 TaxID=2870414 RepID=UPI001E5DD372|nr:carboxylesterase family protein [Nocardioides sp. R-C-SC26]